MTEPHRVVLVRPWVDAHAGAGCCSGQSGDAVVLDHRVGGAVEHHADVHRTAACYRLLRQELPDLDVQLVSVSNTAYLLPWSFTATRRRAGTRQALFACLRSAEAGAVLLDGERIGSVGELGGPVGVLEAVRRRTVAATWGPPGR